jgi:transcription-repair coupling factor (superfamily II helicase)
MEPSETMDDLEEEIEDRFGPIPEPLTNLLVLTGMRQLCYRLGIARIDAGPQAIALSFRPGAAARLPLQDMISSSHGEMRWSGERLVIAASSEDPERRRKCILDLLARLEA